MSEHMIYIKNVTNVTKNLYQNVTDVTIQNIESKEIPTIEFYTKYIKLFVNMLSIVCELLNTKFHNTSEKSYFEVILVVFWCRTYFRALQWASSMFLHTTHLGVLEGK